MRIRLNMDEDIHASMVEDLDVMSEWFRNLPVAVQLAKMTPYLDKQTKRDEKRLGIRLGAAA